MSSRLLIVNCLRSLVDCVLFVQGWSAMFSEVDEKAWKDKYVAFQNRAKGKWATVGLTFFQKKHDGATLIRRCLLLYQRTNASRRPVTLDAQSDAASFLNSCTVLFK